MTVHSLDLTRSDLIATPTPTATVPGSRTVQSGHDQTDEACARLAVAIDLHENDDALARRHALAACGAGRPAFWTTASYHSQKACALHLAAHTLPTLQTALADAYGFDLGTDAQAAALDTLIPLNPAAVAALALAYAALGRWREIQDLEARSMPNTPSHQQAPDSCDKKHAGYRLDATSDGAFHADVNGDSAARRNGTSASGRTGGKT
jgi:hypothetical protein